MIIILCKQQTCTYIYALLVSFKIIFENKSDSTQGIFTKRMKITNEPQHYCILMFRFKLE